MGVHRADGARTAGAGKLLLSAAGPRMRPLLDLALPTFERFAARHGYEVAVAELDDGDGQRAAKRRARWAKVDLLRAVLPTSGTVLWIDADAMICRFDVDIGDAVPGGCFQALALERFPGRWNRPPPRGPGRGRC